MPTNSPAYTPSLRVISTTESSLLIPLTSRVTPALPFPLTSNIAIIVLSRVIRKLNLTMVRDFEELATRRECAALLTDLRLQISREALGREQP